MTLKARLIYVEHLIYWAVWISGLAYALYTFIVQIQYQRHLLDNRVDLKRGTLSNNLYDASDFEWQSIKRLCMDNWSIVFVHIAISNIFDYYHHRTAKLVSWILLSSFTIYHVLNLSALLLILVNVIIVVLLSVLGKNILGYFLFTGVVVSSQITELSFKIFGPRTSSTNIETYEYKAYFLTLALCYVNARGLSAVIDNLTVQEKKQFQAGKDQFFDKLFTISAYLLYLPGIFTGPLFTYHDFEEAVQDKPRNRELKSYALTMWRLFAFLFNVLLYELMLHWIYTSALMSRPRIINGFGPWQLSGYIFALCLMYYQKYMCIFGFFRSVSALDGHLSISPPLPQCPAAMSRSSQLWRHFDAGFYRWIVKYIYKPVAEPSYSFFGRCCGMIAAFSCVAVWHLPLTDQIIYWILINVACVALEMIGSSLATTQPWSSIKAHLSIESIQHIKALIGIPMFAAAVISSMYFLSNVEITAYCVKRLSSDHKYLALFLVFLYIGSHVSMDYEHMREYKRVDAGEWADDETINSRKTRSASQSKRRTSNKSK